MSLSALAASLLVAVPVAIAVLHPGYPAADVDLTAEDVWVTNGTELLAARLNAQIEELDASVATVAADIDVLQDGPTVLLHDRSSSTVESIDPSYTTLDDRADLPEGAELAYGGGILAVLAPATGALWTTDVSGGLSFSTGDAPELARLGAGAAVAVSPEGTVFAASVADHELSVFEADGDRRTTRLDADGDVRIAAVGEHAVVLDGDRVIVDGTTTIGLPSRGLAIQQSGADSDVVLVAGADSLMAVPLSGGDVTEIDARVSAPAAAETDVAAPVNLDGCWHAAWATASLYLAVCGDDAPSYQSIEPSIAGQEAVFRVNRDVVVLNALQTGDSWLVQSDMRLVRNWDEITPPDEDDGEPGDEESADQSFEDTLAERTEQNRPPIAHDDDLGVRTGRSTVLSPLDDDSDPDGDVLTIVDTGSVPASVGVLETIDGGRALQFTPAKEARASTFSFRYTVSDGRPGGLDEATVTVTIHPDSENAAPEARRVGATAVDVGQTITYDALSDWIDPDGDDVYLESAASDAGDRVRFTPDGLVTVTHTSGRLGARDIVFTVSDGRTTASGSFRLDVKPSGSSDPVGTPDFSRAYVGEATTIEPLANDLSPTGEPLALDSAESIQGSLSVTVDHEAGTVTVSAGRAGTYYLTYGLSAGERDSVGLIRVDVTERADVVAAPIAVRDTGYARPGEPTTIAVLDNDVSPTGAVLAVQSVDASGDASSLSVELLSQSVIRVTAPASATGRLQFGYVVSDGTHSATTTVTIVIVPPLTTHQAPDAADDHVRVRVGDVATVPVLDNDDHPDGASLSVQGDLAEEPSAGLAFVSGDEVRYQAPLQAGDYTAVYGVVDEFGQKDVATIVFTVVAADPDANTAPTARTLTARVFAGSSVSVDVPLDGLDPEGDSVTYAGLASAPLLGEARDQTSGGFTYEAGTAETGTDSFTYKIADAYGATAVGTVRIAVIARPPQAMSPVAVDDTVEMRPSRVASVPVLANDSDPNQYALELAATLEEVPEGVTAVVEGDAIVIEAPGVETSFTLRYTVRNEVGGTDSAYVIVRVDEDATVQPPTAEDHVVEQADAVGEATIDVDVRDGAVNPGGRVSDLEVSLDGPNADEAEVLDDGTVRVALGETRSAVAYRLTNAEDGLSAVAFVIVPAYTDARPPRIADDLPEQFVDMNATTRWRLSDIVYAPSGRDVRITDASTVAATRGDGSSSYVDDTTISFTPAADYRGPASVTFEVTDGTAAGTALLVLPVTVGAPDFVDVAPTFTSPTITIEAGEPATAFDLRSASSHPNPSVLEQLTYAGLAGGGGGIAASLDSSVLTVSAPFGVKAGTTTSLTATMSYRGFDVPVRVTVTVVASTRPLPVAVDHAEPDARPGTGYTVDVLTGAFNPFPGQALTVSSARLESGDATVTHDGTTVTVSTGAERSQTISVVYTIRDATGSSSREASARLTVTVTDVPEAPPAPAVAASDGVLSVTVSPSPADNGSAITSYTVVRDDGADSVCTPGVACAFSSENGTAHTFRVHATNGVGDSASSPPSEPVTPYGTPGRPGSVRLVGAQERADSALDISWSAPAETGGGIVRYEWTLSDGESGRTTGTSATTGVKAAGEYTVSVVACSPSACGPASTATVVLEAPPSIVLAKGDEGADGTGYDLTMTGFTPDMAFVVECHSEAGDVTSTRDAAGRPYTTDADGGWSGRSGCADRHGGRHWVEVHDEDTDTTVVSNTVTWGAEGT